MANSGHDESDSALGSAIKRLSSHLDWGESKTLGDFIDDFVNPQLVRLECPDPADLAISPISLDDPFLAFSRRRRTKIYAENLCWDDKTKKFMARGPTLDIPKDYIGWFEVVRTGVAAGQGCLRSVGSVVDADCRYFLLQTTAVGYRGRVREQDGLSLDTEVRVYPGEVLLKGEIVSKKWKVKEKTPGSEPQSPTGSEPQSPTGPETKFLECFDRRKRALYLPLAHPGKFYAIWDSESKDSTPRTDVVYYIQDLLNFQFPLLVRMVFGWPPKLVSQFSGNLRLLGVNRPDSLVLRSLTPQGHLIVEVPVDANATIRVATDMERIRKDPDFEHVLKQTCHYVYPYLISMKPVTIKYRTNANGEVCKQTGKLTGRMGAPRDMTDFSPLDLFPVMEDVRQVSESWSLSFTDPAYLADSTGHIKDENALLMDPEGGKLKPVRLRHLSDDDVTPGKTLAVEILETINDVAENNNSLQKEVVRDRRAIMEQDLRNREATC